MKTKKISDLKVGDKIMSPTGTKVVTELVSEFVPDRMLRIYFSPFSYCECTDDHVWPIYFCNLNVYKNLEARDLFSISFKNTRVGINSNGRKIFKIKEVKPKKVCCIKVSGETNDNLFYIVPKNGRTPVATHNCTERIGCGRLGSIASMMLFGSTIATTIKSKPPGKGITSANGEISDVQYYFCKPEWIKKFYKDAGFDETGRRPNKNQDLSEDVNSEDTKEPKESSDENPDSNESIDDIEDYFNFSKDIEDIEINGEKVGEFDNTQKQDFDT